MPFASAPTTTAMAAMCATPVFAARAPARASAGTPSGKPLLMSRRAVLVSIPAVLVGSTARSANAVAPPAYYDDTMEVIALTRSIITGADLSENNFATFQTKRDKWYAAYQLHHEKGVGYGYANTFNAQAKVGLMIRVFKERGEQFDPERTAYNKEYMLEILNKGKASLDEMHLKGQI